MLDITIIAFDKVRNKNFSLAIAEYAKRLKPYAAIKVIELKAEPFSSGNHQQIKKREGERLLSALEKYPREIIWLLHERGREFDSLKFSEEFKKTNGRMVFTIGGALGFSEEILAKYRQLSLSSFTLPHELARLVLFEQLYRAAAILQGKEYHY